MQSLARRVEARTQRLAESSVQGLFEDPFWFARYGEERARRFGGEDAVFHVRYLVQALEARDAGVLERYARWLQGLLVARGMCSEHLAAHFQGLHVALVREALGEVVPRALRELATREPSSHGQEPRLSGELTLQLSYLMDALGTGRAGLFVEHVRWYKGFWPRRALRCAYPPLLESLEVALAQTRSVSDLPRVTVATGLTALREEQS
jgi:hypothetical protein